MSDGPSPQAYFDFGFVSTCLVGFNIICQYTYKLTNNAQELILYRFEFNMTKKTLKSTIFDYFYSIFKLCKCAEIPKNSLSLKNIEKCQITLKLDQHELRNNFLSNMIFYL
jgi:hypothetical protein